MKSIRVRAYQRQDGTAVRSHDRRGLFGRLRRSSKVSVDNLSALVSEDRPPIPAAEFKSGDLWSAGQKVQSPYSDFQRLTGPLPNVVAALSAAGMTVASVFALAASSIAVFLIPLGIAAGSLLASVIFDSFIYPSGVRRETKEILKSKGLLKPPPSKKQLAEVCSRYDWSATPHETKPFRWAVDGPDYASCVMDKAGWGKVKWKHKRDFHRSDNVKFKMTTYFFPGADLSGTSIKGLVVLPEVNLEGADMSSCEFKHCDLSGANLRGANLSYARLGGNFKGAILKDANLESATLWGDLTDVDFTGANLTNARVPLDLEGLDLTDSQVESFIYSNQHPEEFKYRKFSFEEAIKELDISESEFEYLVISGVINVRDNVSNELIEEGFDPERHHVPSWVIRETKEFLSA